MNHDPSLRRLRHMRASCDGPAGRNGRDLRRVQPLDSARSGAARSSGVLGSGGRRGLRRLVRRHSAVPPPLRPPPSPTPPSSLMRKTALATPLVAFIVDNFLNPRRLDAKLKALALGAWGGEWLVRPQNARAVAVRLVQLGSALSRSLPAEELEGLIASVGQAAARSIPAAPAAAALLRLLWDEDRVQPIVTRVTRLDRQLRANPSRRRSSDGAKPNLAMVAGVRR